MILKYGTNKSATNKGLKVHACLCLSLIVGSVGVVQNTDAAGLTLKSWGLNSGYGVDAPKAWQLMKTNCASSKTVVAVIDTGIDMIHPALKDQLWVNQAELNGKPGVDDDQDGFIDDVHGWDFAKNTGNLSDGHGHGTHIAGIIAGNGKDSDAFKGVCPGAKIMALRYYDPNGSGEDNLRNTIRAIQFAVDHHVDIINYSGGGAEFAQCEFDALKRAEKAGILVVAAAGNERSNADQNLYFPAAYNLTNIISVTAIDESGSVLPSSNWGIKKVHVAAPGQSILSSLPNGGYGFMTGTSQATAFVTGIAALVKAQNASLSFIKIKEIIEGSSQRIPQLVGKTATGAKVNAFQALKFMGVRKLSSASAEQTKASVTNSHAGANLSSIATPADELDKTVSSLSMGAASLSEQKAVIKTKKKTVLKMKLKKKHSHL
jgi:subtilisin family serine protease